MANIPKPKTQKEMLDQLWYAVVGANSEGIAERVRAIDERLTKVERHIPGCITREEDTAETRHTREMRILIAGILITGVVGAAGLVLNLI